MNRLTQDGMGYCQGCTNDCMPNLYPERECIWRKRYNKLREYELTGLEPEEIEELLHDSIGPLHMKLGEWIKAEAEGRMIVLPDLNDHGFTFERGSAVITVFVLNKTADAPDCDTCRHGPPSSFGGKPCCVCDPSSIYTNCYEPREAEAAREEADG